MITRTNYTDLTGTAAADLSDSTAKSHRLHELANRYNIDETKYKVVGISIFGIEVFYVDFICVDLKKSITGKEHIVKISIEGTKDILPLLFKQLRIVMYERSDEKYRNLDIDEEIECVR